MQWLINLMLQQVGGCKAAFVQPCEAFATKYNWLKSTARNSVMGVASATNRRTLILAPGQYIIPSRLVLDTDFIDLASLTGDPLSTVISADLSGDYVVEQSADDVMLSGIKFYNFSASSPSHCFHITAVDNSSSIYRNCEFRLENGMGEMSVLCDNDLGGLWEYCKGDTRFLYSGTDKDITGTFRYCTGSNNFIVAQGNGSLTGSFYSCLGAATCFRSFGSGDLSGTFENCSGDDACFISDTGNCSGTFLYCTAGDYSFGGKLSSGRGNPCSGTFKYCNAGDNSFAMADIFSGYAEHCNGGERCFGGNFDTGSDRGEFTGEAWHCVATNMSFGGGRDSPSKCSGNLFSCKCTGNSSAWRMESARLTGCYLEVVGFERDCVLLNDPNVKLLDCTLIAGTTGTAYSVKAASPTNCVIAHCRHNRNFLNVTNLVATPYNVNDTDVS